MPPGSTVLVQRGADGIYSQAALTFAGSGAAGNPIKFIGENGVRITATRVKPDAAGWTLVPGPAIHLSTRLGRSGTVHRGANPAPARCRLAADLGRGPAAAVHDAIESTFRYLVSAAVLPPNLYQRGRGPGRVQRGTIPRTTSSMSTCSTTPRRRAMERTSTWPVPAGAQ